MDNFNFCIRRNGVRTISDVDKVFQKNFMDFHKKIFRSSQLYAINIKKLPIL